MAPRKCDNCQEKTESLHCKVCIKAVQKVYVENNLLAYVFSHVDGASKAMLIKAVTDHYTYEAIVEAKEELKKAVTVFIPVYRDLQKSRTNSAIRENFVAEAQDIVGAVVELGKITDRDDTFPRFVTVSGKVMDLPPCAPEVANWMTVMEQLKVYEMEMKNLKSSVEANRLELLQQATIVKNCDGRLTNEEGQTRHAANTATWLTAGNKTGMALGDGPHHQPTPRAGPTQQALTPRPPGEEGNNRGHQNIWSTVAATGPPNVRKVQTGETDRPGTAAGGSEKQTVIPGGAEQQTVQQRQPGGVGQANLPNQGIRNQHTWQDRNKRPNKGQYGRYRQTGAIVGTKQGDNNRITSGPVDINIKVWNVTPTCGPQDIKDVITAEGVVVKGEVVELSKPEWRTRSFKITIPAKDRDKILQPEVWSDGVKLGLFYTERKPRDNQVTPNQ